jgi:hypothetical protein
VEGTLDIGTGVGGRQRVSNFVSVFPLSLDIVPLIASPNIFRGRSEVTKNIRLGQGITRPLLKFSRFVERHAGNSALTLDRASPRTAQVGRGLSIPTRSARYEAHMSLDPWRPRSFAVHSWASSTMAALHIALVISSST